MIALLNQRRIATPILWLLFAAAVLCALFTFTDAYQLLAAPLTNDEEPQQADVVIVLGGGVVTHLKTLPWGVQERVRKGVDLITQGYADSMIVAGGLVKDQTYTESEFMRAYAEFLGVSPDAIIEEGQSLDTHQNAQFSLDIMEAHGWDAALIVTSDFHTRRACNVFEKQNANITCIASHPAFTGNYYRNLLEAKSVIRDYCATAYYFVMGYI
ncbi:MAG: YdcF family protein [Patescibacteria group bacterium]